MSRRRKFLPLNKIDISTLINNLDTKYSLICKIILNTGIEVSDIINLKISNVDLNTNTITVSGSDKKYLFNNNLKKDIVRYLSSNINSEYVFDNTDGKQLTVRQIQRRLELFEKKTGIQISTQALRLTYYQALVDCDFDRKYILKNTRKNCINNLFKVLECEPSSYTGSVNISTLENSDIIKCLDKLYKQ